MAKYIKLLAVSLIVVAIIVLWPSNNVKLYVLTSPDYELTVLVDGKAVNTIKATDDCLQISVAPGLHTFTIKNHENDLLQQQKKIAADYNYVIYCGHKPLKLVHLRYLVSSTAIVFANRSDMYEICIDGSQRSLCTKVPRKKATSIFGWGVSYGNAQVYTRACIIRLEKKDFLPHQFIPEEIMTSRFSEDRKTLQYIKREDLLFCFTLANDLDQVFSMTQQDFHYCLTVMNKFKIEAKLKNKKFINLLACALQDPDVEEVAQKYLLTMKEDDLVSTLNSIIQKKDRLQNIAVLRFLRRHAANNDTLMKFIVKLLDQVNIEMQQSILLFLGYQKQDMNIIVPTLIKFLKSPNKSVKMQAIESLGRVGYEAAIAVKDLVELLADSDADVREKTILALPRMGKDAAQSIKKLQEIVTSDTSIRARNAAKEVLQELQNRK